VAGERPRARRSQAQENQHAQEEDGGGSPDASHPAGSPALPGVVGCLLCAGTRLLINGEKRRGVPPFKAVHGGRVGVEGIQAGDVRISIL